MMDSNKVILAGLVRLAKAQIVTDALDGRFTARPDQNKDGRVRSYSDLHDYVDANEYGSATDPGVSRRLASILGFREDDEDGFFECTNQFFGPMQETVDLWIVQGGLAAAVTRVESGFPAGPVRAMATGIPVFHSEVLEVLGEV